MLALDLASELKLQFQRQRLINPRYSLRAYAKWLGVHPSFLSRILSGQREVSLKMARQLGQKIEQKSDVGLDQALVPLDDQTFDALSQWYAFAIMELTQIEGFKWSALYISQKLSITPTQARECMKELVHRKIVTIDSSGSKINIPELSIAHQKNSIASMRRHQKQILLGAIDAMESIPFENRDQSSMTLSFPSSKMSEASKMITRFRRDFLKKSKSWGNPDSVFQLCISFYPVTKQK